MKRLNGFLCSVMMVLVLTTLMVGCSKKSSDDSTPSTTPPPNNQPTVHLSGTAAVGLPIVSASITLKDKTGAIATAVTGTDGKYTADVTGMTAPFLLTVPSGTSNLYSVATTTGTINIHPFTDLIIRNWYKVQGLDVNTVFNGAGALVATPTAAEINTIEAVIRQVLTQLLQSAGIDPTQFNLLTTAFDANNTGFDNILARTQVAIAAGGQVTVTMVDPNTGTTGGTIIAMPINTAITIATNPIDAAKTSINTVMTSFMNTVNAKQCLLTGTDIQPYLVTGYLDQGYDAEAFATTFKDVLGCPGTPTTITQLSITTITTYDVINKTATGTLNFRMANGSGNIGDNLMFNNSTGSWLIDGDQEIAEIHVNSLVQNHIGTTQPSPSGFVKELFVKIWDYLGQIDSVTVTGPGVSTSIPMLCTTQTGSTPSCDHNSMRVFQNEIDVLPTIGSVYSITLTKTDASSVTYMRTLIATPGLSETATDFPNFTGITTHSLSAVIGKTITGQVYTPSWVTEIAAPRVGLWKGDTYFGIDIGSVDAQWIGIPALGQYNSFTVDIPDNPSATTVVLKGDGWNSTKGWGETGVWWYFE